MWIWNKMLASIISASILTWASKCSEGAEANSFNNEPQIENIEVKNISTPEILKVPEIQNKVEKQISLCLETDSPDAFTHTKILESVENPENTVLEFPVSQLFQKYWNRSHPLAVKWIDKNFGSLLWERRIEDLSDSIPQKLSPRAEKITSNTKYEAEDTLRFSLIDPLLQWAFPQKLSQQLKEDWFESFSDSNASDFAKKIQQNQDSENVDKKPDFVYDITVKTLPTWESVLGLYRNWELFMATYVSVWLNNRRTKTWQFEVLWTNPYYFSRKYKSPMSGWVYYDEWWRWFHQWKVRSRNQEGIIKRWVPASHGCIRLPWVYALSLYSMLKGKKHVDVFISKNLYK